MSGDRHEVMVTVSARKIEKEMIKRAAEAAGLSVNRWGRRVLLDAARDELKAALDQVSQKRPDASKRQRQPERAVTRD